MIIRIRERKIRQAVLVSILSIPELKTISLEEDGTIVIYANDSVFAQGTYEGAGIPTITLDKGTAVIKATSAEDVKLIFTADIGTGSEADYELAKVAIVSLLFIWSISFVVSGQNNPFAYANF